MSYIIVLTDAHDNKPEVVLTLGSYHDRERAEYHCHRANAVLIREGSEGGQLKATVHEITEFSLKAVRAWALNEGMFTAIEHRERCEEQA